MPRYRLAQRRAHKPCAPEHLDWGMATRHLRMDSATCGATDSATGTDNALIDDPLERACVRHTRLLSLERALMVEVWQSPRTTPCAEDAVLDELLRVLSKYLPFKCIVRGRPPTTSTQVSIAVSMPIPPAVVSGDEKLVELGESLLLHLVRGAAADWGLSLFASVSYLSPTEICISLTADWATPARFCSCHACMSAEHSTSSDASGGKSLGWSFLASVM